MLRYGKKHDQRCDDKLSRSNRGRTRTSATADDRSHANRGYRRGQEQITEIRACKKRLRLADQIAILDELFDFELSLLDPEIWLHGTDLTAFKDTVVGKKHRGYPFSCFIEDPYAYVPNEYDWESGLSDYENDRWPDEDDRRYCYCDLYGQDRRYCYCDLYGQDDYELDSDYEWNRDPEPIDAAWRDLWVDGHAHDPEGRDQSDHAYDHWYRYDLDYCDVDYLDEIENPLLEREDLAPAATIEAATERAIERHRAGERYFKQTGRTVEVSP